MINKVDLATESRVANILLVMLIYVRCFVIALSLIVYLYNVLCIYYNVMCFV